MPLSDPDDLDLELEDAARRVERERARVTLTVLAAPRITTPCKEPWAKMAGDDRVRFCGRCDKNVFNLSAMTGADAAALLDAHGVDLCVRFFQRPDGTVMTSDCPVGQKRRRRRRLVVTAVAVVAGALGAVWTLTDRDLPTTAYVDVPARHVQGGFRQPPPPPEEIEAVQGGISAERVGQMVAPPKPR